MKAKAETTRTYYLEAGALTLQTTQVLERELFRVAERINPKRAFLFVSTVLGRHIPVHPLEHRAALRALADGVSGHLLPGPVFVMGFAETAVGIGAGVFDCLRMSHGDRDMGYLTTTRFSPEGADDWFTIEESHSHAVDHIILEPRPGVLQHGPDATLVLVDDETTTGKTFAELASGLRAQGLQFGRVVLVTLTDWSDGRAVAAVSGIFQDADVCGVSLQQGAWDWAPKRDWVHSGLPGRCETCCSRWRPEVEQVFAAPRTGIAASEPRQSGEDILTRIEQAGFYPPRETDRVLVVGAGEHVWQPMLAAEALCARGVHTRFITTTRSPILRGETIRHKVSFSDHYGQGFWMYMHNVVPSEWDRILLFTETGTDGLPDEFVNWLGRVDVIDGAGTVSVLTAAEQPA
ncbi:phosphoribosyltransferase domain-containing protein [Puniceibacterium sp. IMCC21224]|uniref:phosphoribosyltransferase domain-containing protein n=1 Tax=Puniceibacterium sp. IMCC21224 TaxID=1618204 RepID=UPI00064DB0A2|nr:phosphoribosyltransferase domain-containing protein [Puniceibacterium sp. IMCC21224]KMK68674.1 Phosphoribosyl transferase/TRSP domain C terminus PRTase 2 [Puniceibacterium sp. IMCC21224]